MSETTQQGTGYRLDFLREVEKDVEEGEWIAMCMQCGVCAGSCPNGTEWQYSPQKIFMMIRAGKRQAVLTSKDLWRCISCYNCIVRCPRGLPITHIMHGLAHYSLQTGLAPAEASNLAGFAKLFWENLKKGGRINEAKLGVSMNFQEGLVSGVKKSFEMREIGTGLLKAGRLNPVDLISGDGCEDQDGIHRMLAKARRLEAARSAGQSTNEEE